jgi:hypothetical protein
MKALLQAGLGGRVSAPPEKRFLISINLDDRVVGTVIFLHEALWLVCGVLVILICRAVMRRKVAP